MADDFWSNVGNMALTAVDQTPVGTILPGGKVYRGVSALANSMDPGVGQSWEQSQKDADAIANREAQFQKLHPYLSAAAKGAGLAANMAIPAGVAGIGARAASRAAAAEGLGAAQGGLSAARSALHTVGLEGLGPTAGNAARAGVASAEQGLAAAEQANAAAQAAKLGFAAPTFSNVTNGLRAMAPSGTTVGGALKTAANYSPAAIPALPMLGAFMGSGQKQPAAAQPASTQAGNPTDAQIAALRPGETPEQTAYRRNLIAVANARSGSAPQQMPASAQPNTAMGDLTRQQQMAYDLQNSVNGGSEPSFMNTKMFPMDNPRMPLGLRLKYGLAMSPRPHYASAADQAGNLRLAIAKAAYAKSVNDPNLTDEQKQAAYNAYVGTLDAVNARNGGMFGTMNALNAYGPQAAAAAPVASPYDYD